MANYSDTKDLNHDKSHVDPGTVILNVFVIILMIFGFYFTETTDSDSASHHSLLREERSKF